MTRVLVCGGRDYADTDRVFAVLDVVRQHVGPLTIIQGGAGGADRSARRWAQQHRGTVLVTENADWRQYGRAAGPLRNAKMIAEHRPDVVLAFPGGRGTADMVRKARAAGIEVQEISE